MIFLHKSFKVTVTDTLSTRILPNKKKKKCSLP